MNPAIHFREALQHPWYALIFHLMGDLFHATSEFFTAESFAPALMPITCSSVSSPMGRGSDSLPVMCDLFGRPTYLADSMQFQLEYLLRLGCPGVFYIMPTFRGEDPDQRHLNQFFHAEAEMVGDLPDVMVLVERYIRHCTKRILASSGAQLRAAGFATDHLTELVRRTASFAAVTFAEAVTLLRDTAGCFREIEPGVSTITHAGERALMEMLGSPVWMTHPPLGSVPFYQATDPSWTVHLCADLFMGIGEVVGCGERHRSAKDVQRALRLSGVREDEYAWYLRMKEEYPLRTAGFGLGLERLLLWVLGHDDIRDIALVPRLKHIESAP